MKLDLVLKGEPGDWDRAAEAEESGYDGIWVPEVTRDPFPMLALMGDRTRDIAVGSSVAVAFARNPMSMAISANDLQLYTNGRFHLGIGSQVKTHITERFAMPWSKPSARMREYIAAIRTIWRSWETGTPLEFHGEFYTHTELPSFFNPGPNPYGNPPILLGGVGPRMVEVAGEVADGLVVHGFTTERYLREVTLPAMRKGRAARSKPGLDDFQICGFPFVVTGENVFQEFVAKAAVRAQIAFYASTPAYRPVLELHGWGTVGDELHNLSKQLKKGEYWQGVAAMSTLITDEMLDEFAVVAPPDLVAEKLLKRYGDIFTRAAVYAPYALPNGFWSPIVRELQCADAG
ncbi:TIGR03617 family F420-dependent LLM class oxidoreductase [Nocardia sp. Marseille-Q1738]